MAMSQQGIDPLLATPIMSAAPLGRRTDGAIGADDQELSGVAVPRDQFDQQLVCFLITDRESHGDQRFAPIGRERKLAKLLLGIEFNAGLGGIENDERFFLDRLRKVLSKPVHQPPAGTRGPPRPAIDVHRGALVQQVVSVDQKVHA